jgi:hypothetical protein
MFAEMLKDMAPAPQQNQPQFQPQYLLKEENLTLRYIPELGIGK